MSTTHRNARGEASRQKILAATVQLVSRYGYDSTTISRIVKETGRPASSIYWLFKNKDELITTALESSYPTAPTGQPRWTTFHPGLPVVEQLTTELAPALYTSETEAPVRVGIMLALEGAASDSQVQTPFRSRRQRIQGRIEEWWREALSRGMSGAAPLPEADRQREADRLSKLTMAFLDGHYISDVTVNEDNVAHRAGLLSHVLWGAFEHSLRECGDCRHSAPAQAGWADEEPAAPEQDNNPDEALLRATRFLVAEHGYEGATVSRICTRAGVQRSSLYWRHKDKDALVKAAVVDPFVELLRPLGELPADTDDWAATLSLQLTEFTRRIGRNPDTVKAGLLLKLQRWDSPTSAGAVVLSGVGEVEKALGAWFDQVLPIQDRREGNRTGHASAGEHLSWLIMRLCDGIMLDLGLWKQGVAFSPEACLRTIFTFALERWQGGNELLSTTGALSREG